MPVTLKLQWGLIPQTAMRPLLIVLAQVRRTQHLRFRHRRKRVTILAFITDCAIKPLLITILPGTPWVNVQRLHVLVVQPATYSQRDKLGPVITPQVGRRAMRFEQAS